MKPQTIEVTVKPNGETIIETKGFTGPSCRDATRSLEQALGIPASEQLTAEFYEKQPVAQNQVQSH